MGGCQSIEGIGPLIRGGSYFSLDFRIQVETGVLFCPAAFEESATVVLGALAPGTYTLTTTSWGLPVTNYTFTVPTNTTPALQPIGFAANGSFQMRLNGAANVGYLLQCSTNFVNWTSLSTNSAGPTSGAFAGPSTLLLTDTSPGLPRRRFYRVQIPQTVTLGPGLNPPLEWPGG
jgi:hypothetical protein